MSNTSYLRSYDNFGGEPHPLRYGEFIPPLWFSLFTPKDMIDLKVAAWDGAGKPMVFKYPAIKATKPSCLEQLFNRKAFFKFMNDPDVLTYFNSWEKFVTEVECFELMIDPAGIAEKCSADKICRYLEVGLHAMDGSRENWDSLLDGTSIPIGGGRLSRRLSPKDEGYFIGFEM